MTRCALLWGQPSQGKPIQLRAGDDAVHTPHCRPRGKPAWPHQHHQRRRTRARHGIGWVCTERDAATDVGREGNTFTSRTHILPHSTQQLQLNAESSPVTNTQRGNHRRQWRQRIPDAVVTTSSTPTATHDPTIFKKLLAKVATAQSVQCCKLSGMHSVEGRGESRRSPGGWFEETCGRHALDVTRPRGSPAPACH